MPRTGAIGRRERQWQEYVKHGGTQPRDRVPALCGIPRSVGDVGGRQPASRPSSATNTPARCDVSQASPADRG